MKMNHPIGFNALKEVESSDNTDQESDINTRWGKKKLLFRPGPWWSKMTKRGVVPLLGLKTLSELGYRRHLEGTFYFPDNMSLKFDDGSGASLEREQEPLNRNSCYEKDCKPRLLMLILTSPNLRGESLSLISYNSMKDLDTVSLFFFLWGKVLIYK